MYHGLRVLNVGIDGTGMEEGTAWSFEKKLDGRSSTIPEVHEEWINTPEGTLGRRTATYVSWSSQTGPIIVIAHPNVTFALPSLLPRWSSIISICVTDPCQQKQAHSSSVVMSCGSPTTLSLSSAQVFQSPSRRATAPGGAGPGLAWKAAAVPLCIVLDVRDVRY